MRTDCKETSMKAGRRDGLMADSRQDAMGLGSRWRGKMRLDPGYLKLGMMSLVHLSKPEGQTAISCRVCFVNVKCSCLSQLI